MKLARTFFPMPRFGLMTWCVCGVYLRACVSWSLETHLEAIGIIPQLFHQQWETSLSSHSFSSVDTAFYFCFYFTRCQTQKQSSLHLNCVVNFKRNASPWQREVIIKAEMFLWVVGLTFFFVFFPSQETEEMLPAAELQFDYINREKRRKCYVLLDDDPQQALQVNNTHTHTHTHTLFKRVFWEVFFKIPHKNPNRLSSHEYEARHVNENAHSLPSWPPCASQVTLTLRSYLCVFVDCDATSSSTLCTMFTTLFMTLVFSHCATAAGCQL